MTTRNTLIALIVSLTSATLLTSACTSTEEATPEIVQNELARDARIDAGTAPQQEADLVEENADHPKNAREQAIARLAGVPGTSELERESTESELDVVDAAMALDVVDRIPQDIDTSFTADGRRVYAFVKVKNLDEPTTITMQWDRDGKTIQTLELDVGKSPGWRTWSYKTLTYRDAGEWTVTIRDAQGAVLETLEFTAEKLPAEQAQLEVLESAMAYGVDARNPEMRDDYFFVGDKVYAWTKILNRTVPSSVVITWKHEGEVKSHIELKVGVSEGWRTWSYKTMGAEDFGEWTVEISDPMGEVLDTLHFNVDVGC